MCYNIKYKTFFIKSIRLFTIKSILLLVINITFITNYYLNIKRQDNHTNN